MLNEQVVSTRLPSNEPVKTPMSPEERLELLADRVKEMAVLPHVVFKVMEISGSSDTSAQEMEKVISIDPGFSSKVLVLANSASIGLPRKVTAVREAILYLGYKGVRSLALTVGTFDLFVGKNDRESLRRRMWWRHSLDTAICCRAIAKHTGSPAPEDAYTSGLIHYIGKAMLDRYGEGDFQKVADMVEFGMEECAAEREVFGCSHVQASVRIAQKWNLPEALIFGLNYAEPADSDDPFCEIRASTAIGSAIARIAVAGSSETSEEGLQCLPEWACKILGIAPERYLEIFHVATAAISASHGAKNKEI